jgi:hypothetical protein
MDRLRASPSGSLDLVGGAVHCPGSVGAVPRIARELHPRCYHSS